MDLNTLATQFNDAQLPYRAIVTRDDTLPTEEQDAECIHIEVMDEDGETQIVGRAYPLNSKDLEGTWVFEPMPELDYELEGKQPGNLLQAMVSYYRDLTENPPEPDMDDPMDGDHESALASAGLGTDEDYGDFGGGDDW